MKTFLKNYDVNQLANIYLRYKDQFNILPDNLIEKLHIMLMEQFELIADKILFTNESCDDYEENKEFYKKTGMIKVNRLNNNSILFPGELNLYFRAWHDDIHYYYNLPFGFDGELQTFYHHVSLISDEQIKQILFSEIVLQTAYYEKFGKFPDKQKVILINYEKLELPSTINCM